MQQFAIVTQQSS